MLRPGLSVIAEVDTRRRDIARRADERHRAHAPCATAGRSLIAAGRMRRSKVFAFASMCVGMFIALLDIQIVSASLRDIGGGLSAGAGRDRLGADHLPDRRDRGDPAVGLALPRVLDPLAVLPPRPPASPSPACCAAWPGTSRA